MLHVSFFCSPSACIFLTSRLCLHPFLVPQDEATLRGVQAERQSKHIDSIKQCILDGDWEEVEVNEARGQTHVNRIP